MPVKTSPMLIIASDTKMRVHERILAIKGEDKRISSDEEARAILSIPTNKITFFEDKNELPLARYEANNYLKYGDRCLRDDLVDFCRYCKKQAVKLYKRASNWINSH